MWSSDAEGTSEAAKGFNCVQRGHQQALETYGSFVALSLVGGVRHPLLTTAAGLVWTTARMKCALLRPPPTLDPGRTQSHPPH